MARFHSATTGRIAIRAALLSAILIASGCATSGGANADIPEDAVPLTRTEPNGDTVTEYRVAGQLRAVMVVPSRGPTYYLYDHDGDGIPDKAGDNSPQTYFKLFQWK
jgi:hypothetical protein